MSPSPIGLHQGLVAALACRDHLAARHPAVNGHDGRRLQAIQLVKAQVVSRAQPKQLGHGLLVRLGVDHDQGHHRAPLAELLQGLLRAAGGQAGWR